MKLAIETGNHFIIRFTQIAQIQILLAMTKSYLFVLSAFSWLIATKTQNNAFPPEDLVAEYYTTTNTDPGPLTKQDEVDATDIWNSDRKEDMIASIIMYRDKPRRYAITEKIRILYGCESRKRLDNYWIYITRNVQETTNSTDTFKDLLFSLTYHENNVLNAYLSNFLYHKDETRITIGMVLTKDMVAMIEAYDKNYSYSFATKRNEQREPFKFMLRAWVRHPREPIEKDQLDPNVISQDADELKKEYDDGGWHEKRDKLEFVLMRKSIKYARAVIEKFEELMALNKPMEDIIDDCVPDHNINHDLAHTYSSLTRYIKDKYGYIARILNEYCDGTDQWAAWFLCMAVMRPEEWPKVDEIFTKAHNGDSLSKFILQKLDGADHKVMAEMMAMTVDSKFKPTSFTKRTVSGDPGKPPGVPPPVSPTVPAPSPP